MARRVWGLSKKKANYKPAPDSGIRSLLSTGDAAAEVELPGQSRRGQPARNLAPRTHAPGIH